MPSSSPRPRLVHLTTVDMSLVLLLLPQLVAFREAGFDVVGVSAPGPYVADLEDAGIRHVSLPSSTRAMDPRADVRAMTAFVRLCRRLDPDIVHTHNPKPGVYGRIGARIAGVPRVVNTVHGLYAQPTDPWPRRAAVYTLERLAASFSHAELVQNPEDLTVLRRLGVPPERLHLLGNGVDLDRFDPDRGDLDRRAVRAELGIDDDTVVVGVVGRLVVEKGYREVVAAAERLATTHPGARVLVVGPYEPDKADALDAGDLRRAEEAGVRLLGARQDMERMYSAMDLYVLASHREGFPRSAMEAAAMGLPIVTTDIRGCRQVVDHGTTGLLVPVCDAAALAEAVGTLVEDRGRRLAMGAAARAKARREFDDRRQVKITLSVYRDLLDRRRDLPDRSPGAGGPEPH